MPTIGILFPLYCTKDIDKGGRVSISALNRVMITPYSSNYKNYKDKLVRVHGIWEPSMVIYEKTNDYRFPLYRISYHVSINEFNYDKLNETKKDVVDFLREFCIL